MSELQKQWFAASAGGKMPLPPLPTGYTAVEAIKGKSGYARLILPLGVENIKTIKFDGRFIQAAAYGGGGRVLACYPTVLVDDTTVSGTEQTPGTNYENMNPSIPASSMLSNEYQTLTLYLTSPLGSNPSYPYTSLFNWRTQTNLWAPLLAFRSIKVYNFNDELIAYLQPCIKIADSTIGYYDLVNNRFWYSSDSDYANAWALDN